MKIQIETIRHSSQRYPTPGDWFWENGTLHIKVSNMSDERYAILTAVHELIEVILCKHRGITQEAVDRFDEAFERERTAALKAGITKEQYSDIIGAEAGDDLAAPYNKEHCFATGIERLLAAELNVSWNKYAKEVVDL